MPKSKIRIPKSLALCADKLYQLKVEKSKAQKVVDQIDADMKMLKAHLIDHIPKGDATGVVGKLAKAVITTKDIPTVRDWPKFYAHVLKTKNFALMQKRLAAPAINEIWEDGKKVPGVEPFTTISVSITKAK